MKERPILFSAAMVRALLAGTKTQTRRALNPQPIPEISEIEEMPATEPQFGYVVAGHSGVWEDVHSCDLRWRCPFGVPGDRLWVREEHYRYGHWEPVLGVLTAGGRQKWRFVADTPEVRYNDNAPEGYRKAMHRETPDFRIWHKRLARFMPRAASRITLEVTGVSVERLHDIIEADAVAEGVDSTMPFLWHADEWQNRTPGVARFAGLWDRVNRPGAWAENPWVWAVSFRVVKGGGS